MAKSKKPEQAIFYQNFKGAIYGGTPEQVKNLMTAFCQYAFLIRSCCGLLLYCPELSSFALDYTVLQIITPIRNKTLYHIKVFKSIGNCFFLFRRANKFFALTLTNVVVFSFLDTVFIFNLSDIQG